MSRSTVLSLHQNDLFTLYVTYNSYSYLNCNRPIWLSIKGFLYVPSHRQPVAWSVFSKSSENYFNCPTPSLTFYCLKNNLTFDTVSVNISDVWAATTNKAIIPVGGLYYVTFALVFTQCHLEATLCVNNVATTFIVITTCSTRRSIATKERAVLLNLKKGDKLNVKLINGTLVLPLTESMDLTSFAGILLYPL